MNKTMRYNNIICARVMGNKESNWSSLIDISV